MNHDYPHLSDTEFPDLQTANVYKYENTYDYDKYQDTIKIKMMNVSWCGDYENGVYFETKKLRDEWFDRQKGQVRELSTMFRLYSDGSLKVDMPIDECMDYNYAMIDYGKLPNQSEKSDNSRIYYFISDMSQASVNATELTLSLDYWTTYINDMDITYVNLERGHAPMAATTAEEYLENPIENSEYLLTADVSYGEFQRVSSTEPIILNDEDVMLGFLTNGDLSGSWADRVATSAFYLESQALSAIDIWIIDTDDWYGFRDTVTEQCPQFWTTVKGMFLIPRKLLNTGRQYRFCGYTVYYTDTNGDKNIATYDITKQKFGYSSNIADIAKLYTFPYAAIEVNDFKGNSTIIKVEDTIGSLELHTIMCDMYPFLNVEAYMLGIGGNVRTTVDFVNVYDNTIHIGGRCYEFTTKWSIPVFAVQLTVENNWELYHKIGAEAALENTRAINTATLANVDTANSWAEEKTFINNAYIADTTKINTDKIYDDSDKDWIYAYQTGALVQDYAAGTTITNVAAGIGVAAVGVAATALTAGVAAEAAGLAGTSGATALGEGASLAVIGAGGAVANGVISGASANASYGYFLTKNSGSVALAQNMITGKTSIAVGAANDTRDKTIAYNLDIIEGEVHNNLSVTTNSANTSNANASRSYNAQLYQNNLSNPPEFGQLTGTPDIISKPLGYTYNIVTQSKNAIRQAAEQFLRYGYMLNMEWNIGSFNLMPKFTYWKCDAVYCNDNGVFEGAQDMIKSILNRGITVWKNPDEIGMVSIYQNI